MKSVAENRENPDRNKSALACKARFMHNLRRLKVVDSNLHHAANKVKAQCAIELPSCSGAMHLQHSRQETKPSKGHICHKHRHRARLVGHRFRALHCAIAAEQPLEAAAVVHLH